MALLSACLAAANALAADAPPFRPDRPSVVVAPVFNHAVLFSAPVGWQEANKQSNAQSLLMEMLPRGQTLGDWRELITLKALRGFGDTPNMTPGIYLAMEAGRIAPACEGESIKTSMGDIKVDGYPAHVAVLGCPTVRGAGRGEVALHVAILAGRDLVVLQKAVRAAPFTKDTAPMTAKNARAVYETLGPIKLCERGKDPGECLARPVR